MNRALVALFGFALAVAYWPGWVGAATSPRWAIAAAGVAAAAFVPSRPTLAHWTGGAFVAWCLASTIWSEARLDSVAADMRLLIGVGLFLLGAGVPDLRPFYRAAAVGLGVSTLLAIGTVWGFPLVSARSGAAGLFTNSLFFVEAGALIAIALVTARDELWALSLVPIVMVAHGRGAVIAALVAIAVWSRAARWPILITLGLAPVLMAYAWLLYDFEVRVVDVSVVQRLALWRDALAHLTLVGYGNGTFSNIFPAFATHTDTASVFAEHAHNMALELIFECGFVGFWLAAAFFGTLLAAPASPEKFVLITFIVDGLYAFPDQMPFTFAVAALAAGHLSRGLRVVRLPALLRRGRSHPGDGGVPDQAAHGGGSLGGYTNRD